MKHKSIFFIIHTFIFTSFAMHGMEKVDEWIGIQKYWNSTRYHSIIYRHCTKNTNDQNCAIINAYFLLVAQEKKYLEMQVKSHETKLHDIAKRSSDDTNGDFIERRRLQENRAAQAHFHERSKKQLHNQLQNVIKQLEMGNLSDNPQDNVTQKKLGHAFNMIVSPQDNVHFELDCLKETQEYAQQGRIPYKGSRGSKVGNGWKYAATGPQDDDM